MTKYSTEGSDRLVYEPDTIDKNAPMSTSTRRAYYSDLQVFIEKTGRALPVTMDVILDYLDRAADQVNPRTLCRHLSMLRKWHRLHHHPDPTNAIAVK